MVPLTQRVTGMFLTEEQSRERLNSPHNLANRFKSFNSGKEDDNASIIESRISAAQETTEKTGAENREPSQLYKEGIQFREIRRPGNNRPWLSQQERTGIATSFIEANAASSSGYLNEDGHKIRQKEVAAKYGVQVSTVSDIVNGVRRVEDSPRSVEQEKVDLALDAVREKAIDRLMAGLGQLTDDKVSAHNAKDISVICSNMSKVVKDTIPQEKTAQQINLVVYTPELRAEKNFDIIEIG